MPYQPCNPSYQSQIAYLNNQTIHINEYLPNRDKYNGVLQCNKGHPLIAVNCDNRKKHFRHKHASDVSGKPMTEWHAEWQGNFPKTEVSFPRINEEQICDRRADIDLNDTNVVECQHCPITKDEVFGRKHDYKLHGKNVIWIIDGNQGIEVKKLNSDRYFLYFNESNHEWKYRSFNQYEYIYIDINSMIYKIFPTHVKSHMTDVECPKTKDEFIKSLNDSINLWSDVIPPQCELFVKQQGAGNGKTYAIIQNLTQPTFLHYKTVIIVTKQHSNKTIVKFELLKQFKDKDAHFYNYEFVDNTIEGKKHFMFDLINKETGDVKKLIFCTIDSFMYSVGNQNERAYDAFLGTLNEIINGNLKLSANNTIKIANITHKLNKETLFVVDECQDLAIEYARAIVQIMRTTYIDALVVGDMLQSIAHEDNAFRFFSSDSSDIEIAPFIKRAKMEPTNVCYRFGNTELVTFVNSIVPFSKYGLPCVTAANPSESSDKSIHFFQKVHDDTVSYDDNFNKNLNIIINLLMDEIRNNNRKPNDILIVVPFTSNNPLAQELQLRLHMVWDLYLENTDDSKFNQYVVFHRSQEGTSINLDESKDATRIVSCHAAKGDGRKVVFLVGFTESAINTFSKKSDSLIFDSIINVMSTRMMEKLYIQYIPNEDAIHRKYHDYCKSVKNKELDVIPVLPSINTKYKLSKILCNNTWDTFETIVSQLKIEKIEIPENERQIIDMGHHMFRMATMHMKFIMGICNKEQKLEEQGDMRKKQNLRIFDDIGNANILYCDTYFAYKKALNDLTYSKVKTKVIPILRLKGKTSQGKYYSEIISVYMKKIIQFINDFNNKKNTYELCPFEYVILYYMINIIKLGVNSEISIYSIYDVLDRYAHVYINTDNHTNCTCNTFFNNTRDLDISNKYHVNHYDKLVNIKHNLNYVYDKNPNIAWLYNHTIYFDGKNNDYTITENIMYHGYDDTLNEIVLCHVVPQFNSLNEKDIMMKIITEAWMLLHYNEKHEGNVQKYRGKKIKAYIISLDSNTPAYIYNLEKAVEKYDNDIYQLLFDKLTEKFEPINESIYYYYKHARELMISKSTSLNTFCKEFYRQIKNKYQDDSGKYINNFFIGQLLMENNNLPSTLKNTILQTYDDKEFFINELNEKLYRTVADFLDKEYEKETDNSDN
jgi:hypothetical protein